MSRVRMGFMTKILREDSRGWMEGLSSDSVFT
jgi:hypothetical protein